MNTHVSGGMELSGTSLIRFSNVSISANSSDSKGETIFGFKSGGNINVSDNSNVLVIANVTSDIDINSAIYGHNLQSTEIAADTTSALEIRGKIIGLPRTDSTGVT